ncbi:MAG: hypothetical protein ACRD15_06190 [Vicinamibacterales bacterium]
MRFAWGVLAAAAVSGTLARGQTLDRRQVERIEQALRQEADAVIALAEAPADDRSDPTDFQLAWRNDFFKAQAGTFVPFILDIDARAGRPSAALVYVRVARRGSGGGERRDGRRRVAGAEELHPFDEIYPVDLAAPPGHAVRVIRGFSVAPGEYDLTIAVREREEEGDRRRRRKAGMLRRPLSVPDFSGPGLTTSSIILADDLVALREPPAPAELTRRPYVMGLREIRPAADAVFRRSEELIVVFLVYNPAITPDEHFDLEVEYHFFRKSGSGVGGQEGPPGGRPAARPGETYVNRTEPQRFNPLALGPEFDPASGQPVMAGQGVPLADFLEGDYRLAIAVKDLVSGRALEREVTFTVGS